MRDLFILERRVWGERMGERVGTEKETDPGFKNCYAT